jgi:PKD repeat protein
MSSRSLSVRTRGQSEVVSVLLMVGLTVAVVGGAGAVYLNQTEAESAAVADLRVAVTDDTVTLSHQGGDSIPFDSLLVVVENETETWRYTPSRADLVVGDTDGAFDPGERWRLSAVPYQSGDVLTVAVFDTGGGGRLTTRQRAARPAGGGGSSGPSTPTPTPTATPTPAPSNDAPSASLDANRTTVRTGESIRFSDLSTDPDGTVTARTWDFDGDGTTDATDATVATSYADDGTYTVELEVTDDDGATDATTTTVTVANRAPTVSLSANRTDVQTLEDVAFSVAAADSDGAVATVEWDLDGDGTTDATGTSVVHDYADDGAYTVTVTVTDDDGATSSTATTVTVANRRPSASFTAKAVSTDGNPSDYEEIVYDASTATDADGELYEYRWVVESDDDVSTYTTTDPVYRVPVGPLSAVNASGTVSLTVVDDDGATDTASNTGPVKYDFAVPGFRLVAALLAVLLGSLARRRGYL